MEFVLTAITELLISKHRIFEIYLNVIEWGNLNYGIEAASRYYFNKSANDLNFEESCILATMIPNPHIINPIKNEKLFYNRWKLYLSILTQYGIMTKQEYQYMLHLDVRGFMNE
ncbi:MAG: biosynthetic peptidoglycan transglycosylase, partial [Candidatus Hodarchaeota archaeon]